MKSANRAVRGVAGYRPWDRRDRRMVDNLRDRRVIQLRRSRQRSAPATRNRSLHVDARSVDASGVCIAPGRFRNW